MPEIRFYGSRGEYGCFSNFARYPIRLGGRTWPTSEHYFQAQKFAGTDREELVRRAKRPHEAARLGRDRSAALRRDWQGVKLSVMREAVRAKFTQHAGIREKLLGTGRARIVEHTARDSFWGDGGDGSGRNWLGRILMEVCQDLRTGRLAPEDTGLAEGASGDLAE